jgi:translation initiation factor 3 subunit B
LQEAELAKEKTNGYKLDRAHIFAVNMIEDFNRFMKVPDEWAPPEIRPYVPGVISSIIFLILTHLFFC